MLLFVLSFLFVFSCSAESNNNNNAAAGITVDVVVPENGDVIGLQDQLHINAFIDGLDIPNEGYAIVWVNKKEVGRFKTNQFTFSRANPLRVGQHVLTIRVYNNQDIEIEQAFTQKRFTVEEMSQMAAQDEFVAQSDAVPVASMSSAFGEGLSSATAGVAATFSIVLRDERGHVVISQVPPKLVVVITPAPLKNSLTADEHGHYLCNYECEFGGVDVEVGILLDDVHISNSPFKFRSNLSYTVNVHQAFRTYPRPPVPASTDQAVIARSNPKVREYFIPQKWMELGTASTGGGGRFAYVTMITGDDYLTGALLLLYGLRKVGVTDTDIVCMITENIREDTVTALSTAGFLITRVQKIDIPHRDMVEARWSDNYTKLRMWRMLQYDRIIYLDADMVVLQPLDHLFHINIGPANFAATPDCWLPTFFSAAMFVMKPSLQTYDSMVAALKFIPAEESEQTFLNEYFFEAWVALHYSHNTPKNYGMTPTRFNLMVQRHMHDIRVIHYMGLKPFLCTRYKDCTSHVPYYNIANWHELWWNKFDEMCEEGAVECL